MPWRGWVLGYTRLTLVEPIEDFCLCELASSSSQNDAGSQKQKASMSSPRAKGLQVLLPPCLSEFSVDENGMVQVFGSSFNFDTEEFAGVGRRPHPFHGLTVGTVFGLHQTHKSNDGKTRRKNHAGLSTRHQLWGSNLSSHQQGDLQQSRMKAP